jgi:hypothetical protein
MRLKFVTMVVTDLTLVHKIKKKIKEVETAGHPCFLSPVNRVQ